MLIKLVLLRTSFIDISIRVLAQTAGPKKKKLLLVHIRKLLKATPYSHVPSRKIRFDK